MHPPTVCEDSYRHAHTRTHTCTRTHTPTHTHTHTHKCAHTHTHTHTLNTDQFVVGLVLVEAQQCPTQCGVVALPGAVGGPAASFIQLILTVEVAFLVNLQDGGLDVTLMEGGDGG